MRQRDALGRALAQVRSELSPANTDKERLRARVFASYGTGNARPGDARPEETQPEDRRHEDMQPGDMRPAVEQSVNPGAPSRAAATGWRALRASGRLGLAVGLVLLGGGAGIGFSLGRQTAPRAGSDPPAMTPAASPHAEAPVASADALPESPASPPADSARATAEAPEQGDGVPPPSRRHAPASRAAAKLVRPARAFSPSPLDSELALLRRVERALRANDAALALALLSDLDEQFPETRLREERLAARQIAECKHGGSDAQASARDFLREHRSSVYRERVEQACAPITAATPPALKIGESPDTHAR